MRLIRSLPKSALIGVLLASSALSLAKPPPGRPAVPGKPLIVGGTDAEAGAYPWMAALLLADDPDPFQAQFCGGALIHPRCVLTAAHCIEGMYPSEVEVWIGSNLLESGVGVRIGVADIRVFPAYDSFLTDSDLALLILEEPVDPALVTPVALISDLSLDDAGVMARVIGWGASNGAEDEYPRELQEADLPIVANAVASPIYDDEITDNMLFAGYAEGGVNTCGGDSGGPMLARNARGEWELIGLTSFGRGDIACDDPENYGAYTRVANFVDWIRENLSPLQGAWETHYGMRADRGDADADGVTNWDEFALGTDPKVADSPSMQLEATGSGASSAVKLTFEGNVSGEVSWRVAHSGNLLDWAVDNSLGSYVVSDVTRLDDVGILYSPVSYTLGDPLEAPVFFRLVAWPSDAVPSPAYSLTMRNFAYTGLSLLDPLAAGKRTRRYHLALGDNPTQTARLAVRSAQAPVSLLLRDLNLSGSDIPGIAITTSTDHATVIEFRPQASGDYVADVSMGENDIPADFRIAFYPIEDLTTQSIPGTRHEALQTSDPVDTLDSETYYRDDFFLTNLQPIQHVVVEMKSTALDALLELVDFETGELLQLADDYNPGAGNYDAYLNFALAASDAETFVRASSAYAEEVGNYTLSFAYGPSVALGATAQGSLSTSDPDDPIYSADGIYYRDDLLLTGLTAGSEVTLRLSPSGFDAFLELIDARTGEQLDVADNAGIGGAETLTFTPRASVVYFARVTSYDEEETGSYSLRVQ